MCPWHPAEQTRLLYVHDVLDLQQRRKPIVQTNRRSVMAEVIGIVAAAIAFAQATAVVLDAMNKIKDASKNIRELQHEIEDLAAVLGQIDDTFLAQKGDPTDTALRSCAEMLKNLHDLIVPLQQEIEDNKLKQYMKGLRLRPKESEIESAVKRLQSQKLTLTLALISSMHRSDSIVIPLVRSNFDARTDLVK